MNTVVERSQDKATRPLHQRTWLPWLLLAVLLLLLLVLLPLGYWRSSGVGPQVQVPMFYDAHYLYPRPWTQAQAAPGVPENAPLAFYGANRVSQTFQAGADNLAQIVLRLDGPPGTLVTVVLTDDRGQRWEAITALREGDGSGVYRFTIDPVAGSAGRSFTLSLAAREAGEEAPVLAYSVGGDRLGEAWRLNAFSRPGNLALTTYSRGDVGSWWLEATTEQLLPAVFRLRLQQYKPPALKGNLFGVLLVVTAVLTVALLWLARPDSPDGGRSGLAALGWVLLTALSLFLGWQLMAGRLQARAADDVFLASAVVEPAMDETPTQRLLYADLSSDLWSAAREPEARFVRTETHAGLPAIVAPAGSRLAYTLTVPPAGKLRLGVRDDAESALSAQIKVNESLVTTIPAGAEPVWTEVDLGPWVGQGIVLELSVPKAATGSQGELAWLMPQISTAADWLYAPDAALDSAAGYTFETVVTLRDFNTKPQSVSAGQIMEVELLWQLKQESDRYGTVFVHLLDQNGRLVAQHDSQPAGNAFPFAQWQSGMVVRDRHPLSLPADLSAGQYTLAVGIYDPADGTRWQVQDPEGLAVPDGRVVLSPPLEVSP